MRMLRNCSNASKERKSLKPLRTCSLLCAKDMGCDKFQRTDGKCVLWSTNLQNHNSRQHIWRKWKKTSLLIIHLSRPIISRTFPGISKWPSRHVLLSADLAQQGCQYCLMFIYFIPVNYRQTIMRAINIIIIIIIIIVVVNPMIMTVYFYVSNVCWSCEPCFTDPFIASSVFKHAINTVSRDEWHSRATDSQDHKRC